MISDAPITAASVAHSIIAQGRPRSEAVAALCAMGKDRKSAAATVSYVCGRRYKGRRNGARQAVDGQRRKPITVLLPVDTAAMLIEESAARGVSISALCARLLEIIEGAEMWDAILDGEMPRGAAEINKGVAL